MSGECDDCGEHAIDCTCNRVGSDWYSVWIKIGDYGICCRTRHLPENEADAVLKEMVRLANYDRNSKEFPKEKTCLVVYMKDDKEVIRFENVKL